LTDAKVLGGRAIVSELRELLTALDEAVDGNLNATPWDIHYRYERLHPFRDGNGRSGRVLWAWHMLQLGRDPFALPFLHRAYYEALGASRPLDV